MSHTLSNRYRPIRRYTPQDNRRYSRNLGIKAAAEIFVKRGFSPATVRTMDRPWSAEIATAMEKQQRAGAQ